MVFGFLKKLFKRGGEEELEDLGGGPGEEPKLEEPSFQTESIPSPQIPQPTYHKEELQMFNPPQTQAQYPDYLKDQINLLMSKLDVLNAKLDQIIQKLNLIETYIKYK